MMRDTAQALTWSLLCLYMFVYTCVWLCIVRCERQSHGDSSCPRTPSERCYQPAVADPDSSHIEVKINSPDSPVCLSEDDGLRTFLLCTQVLCLLAHRTSTPPPLHFHLSSSSLSSQVSRLPPLSLHFCLDGAFFLHLFIRRPCLFNEERMKGSSRTSYSLSHRRSLSPFPPDLAVMFNQRDRDRTFHRDKVNGTVKGWTKLLTPRQLNMNKRCPPFFLRHCTTLNISRNKRVQLLCYASFSCLNVTLLCEP